MAIIRLAPGVTTEAAGNALDATIRHLDEQDPSLPPRVDKGRRLTLLSAGYMVPLPKKLRIAVSGFFLVLMTLIMTIACMNLANLLLARGTNRQKEFAIRLAVGASRFRLVRQMLSEGILLSLLGGIAGFAVAYVATVLNAQLRAPTAVPMDPDPNPDWHVAIFVFILAIVCGIGFSLAPALRASKAGVTPALKEAASLHLPGYRRFGLRNLMMVTQVAGSLMLVLIIAFLVTGIRQMSSIQTKFDPHNMVLLSIDPMREGYTPEKAQALFEKLPEQLKAAGGVRSLALTSQEPFSIEDDDDPVPLTTENGPAGSRVQVAAVEETVGAGYFAALSEPMIAGREFTGQEQTSTPDGSKRLPVVLNESAARNFFGNTSAIGRTIRDDKQSYEVVGVVPDLKNGMGMRHPEVYLPLTRRDFAHPLAGGTIIMARADPGTDALPRIRSALAVLDPTLSVFNVQTLNDYLELSREYERFSLATYAAIGVFGLVLAAIGLAGVTAYTVAQRRKEIGIRMALGARKGQVLRLVMREGTALVATGTVLGFLGAFALSKTLSSLMHEVADSFQVGTSDPRLLAGIPLLLAGCAMLACYLPARKSANIDPLQAVREE